MAQNLVEKIAERYAVGLDHGAKVRAGDYLTISPAHVMTHDNTGAVIPKFKSIGAKKIAKPRQPVYALDHNVQDKTDKNLAKYAGIEKFAADMGVDFYPAGRGIGHQIMCEEGYAWPFTMMVASDSHSNMYGGLGCLGTPIVRTDAAALWASGQTWWQVPPVARCELSGKLHPGVTGKDVIIALCGHFNNDEVLNHAVEFVGDGVARLSLDERLTIANMTTEWGALVGLFPVDRVTINWLKNRAEFIARRGLQGVPSDVDGRGEHPRINKKRIAELERQIITADPDAHYAKRLTLDLSTVSPHISGPDHVKKMTSLTEARASKIKIDKAYLVSCVNSRVEDLAQAADVIRGKRVADHVKFYVAAASSEVQAESLKRGDWQALLEAGAIELPPGCGPCIGLGDGLLDENEVGISATNRNFKGRMGAKSAKAYLASPAVVAASAVAGFIDIANDNSTPALRANIQISSAPASDEATVRVLSEFPSSISGELIFCHQDNLNTDGIYPGKYTYMDDFTPEQQAGVVMENYDPEFGKIVQKGDIVIGGYNFGTGSSREQAATALKYRGIQLVLAGSFSETYKRNALNNGFLAIEVPSLVDDLKKKHGTVKLTFKPGGKIEIDFTKSKVKFDGVTYDISPIGVPAQELIIAGGLEAWVEGKLK